jgi:hypothetical protein
MSMEEQVQFGRIQNINQLQVYCDFLSKLVLKSAKRHKSFFHENKKKNLLLL